MEAFEKRNNSTVCLDLLGCDISTPEGKAKAHQGFFRTRCTGFVRDAVEIVQGFASET